MSQLTKSCDNRSQHESIDSVTGHVHTHPHTPTGTMRRKLPSLLKRVRPVYVLSVCLKQYASFRSHKGSYEGVELKSPAHVCRV